MTVIIVIITVIKVMGDITNNDRSNHTNKGSKNIRSNITNLFI